MRKNKFNITKENLFQKYIGENKSIYKISNEIKCSSGTIYNLLKDFNIKRRKPWEHRIGHKLSINEKLKISLRQSGENNSFFGKKHTIKTKKKISRPGITNSFCGKSHTIKTKEKIRNSDYHKNLQKEKHPNWLGGNTEYGSEFDNKLKEQVRFRDEYICQICGCSQLENGKQLDVHHIDYNKKNNILSNLISLCISCHRRTNFNRNYWRGVFNHFKLSRKT